ncbi:MAG: replication-associated recombination protein A [Ruminococcus sp.]|jgi:putative ATPase|nr:replication-associated recombination protein A [Ruminococcus sp.]
MNNNVPLAERMRPEKLTDVAGQADLIPIFQKFIDKKTIPNMLFFGPSGVGKTTVAQILCESTDRVFYKLNGTTADTSNIKEICKNRGVLLYLDEIQYLNKKQQQTLLEFMENGSLTLIASTTENPYFAVYKAILSRCSVFEFNYLEDEDICKCIMRNCSELGEEAAKFISANSGGDLRKAYNIIELCSITENYELDNIKNLVHRSSMHYDKNGDEHFNILSAFQKSMRGSDVNASLHYLARLIEAGDLISLTRRLLVTACEDVGLAKPSVITIVKSCVDTAFEVGFPEARIPLSMAVILVATAPKDNRTVIAVDKALDDVRHTNYGGVPDILNNLKNSGLYKYPHDYPGHYVEQTYMPKGLEDRVYL